MHEDIFDMFSPFTTTIQPAGVDARKVAVTGVGIRPEGVPASLPISFKVDTREAGQSNLDVVVKVGLYTIGLILTLTLTLHYCSLHYCSSQWWSSE